VPLICGNGLAVDDEPGGDAGSLATLLSATTKIQSGQVLFLARGSAGPMSSGPGLVIADMNLALTRVNVMPSESGQGLQPTSTTRAQSSPRAIQEM
jgi:hypothetical protein